MGFFSCKRKIRKYVHIGGRSVAQWYKRSAEIDPPPARGCDVSRDHVSDVVAAVNVHKKRLDSI